MQQYGLIGHPLGHSFSATFFAEKFAREHIDARYENFDLAEVNDLRDWVSAHPELVGFNVTIPHKQAVVPQLDSLSPEATEVGAVNVVRVRRTDGGGLRLDGHNSDLLGFTRSIAPLLCPHHRRALVLGTGGASKAVVVGLRRWGLEVTYVSRRPSPPRTRGCKARACHHLLRTIARTPRAAHRDRQCFAGGHGTGRGKRPRPALRHPHFHSSLI